MKEKNPVNLIIVDLLLSTDPQILPLHLVPSSQSQILGSGKW